MLELAVVTGEAEARKDALGFDALILREVNGEVSIFIASRYATAVDQTDDPALNDVVVHDVEVNGCVCVDHRSGERAETDILGGRIVFAHPRHHRASREHLVKSID